MNLHARMFLLTLALAATLISGCSGSRQLQTPGQSAEFAIEVADGESPDNWTLASQPSHEAAQAWADRKTIVDLGRRLNREGSSWACETARKSVGLAALGYFDHNDYVVLTKNATEENVPPNRIATLLHDITTLHYRELVLVTTSVCGPYHS